MKKLLMLIILFASFLSLYNCGPDQGTDLKNQLLSVGNELKTRVDEVLKQLKANPKPNSAQQVILLENNNNELAKLLFLLKQAQSNDNIKQIEKKLKDLETRIENEIDELNKMPTASTRTPTTTTKIPSLPSETTSVKTVSIQETTIDTTKTTVEPTFTSTEGTHNNCNENQNLLTNASELKEKAKKSIKQLTDSHRISEAMGLIADEKQLEQLIEKLQIYFKEIDYIKTELSTIRLKINNETVVFN